MKDAEFERLLKISRVRLSLDEKTKIRKDIEEIITYFDRIRAVKCSEKPAYQPIDVPTRFRKDAVRKFNDIEGLKKGTTLQGEYIRGPKL
jgi:aspartyl/glutamyl-tRNA(Asn/Gln) amidotransferase C subunit